MKTPAEQEALRDPLVTDAAFRVLSYLHEVLDYGEYRPLKLWPIAQELRKDKATIGKVMKKLVECGYIRQGRREKPGGRSYLLLTTRGQPLRTG